MHETELQQQIRLALGHERDLVLWRNTVGFGEFEDGSKARFGLGVGSSDLIGILAPQGRFIGLEVKLPKALARILRAIAKGTIDKLSDTERAQILFINLVRARGGFGAFVDSEESAKAALARARTGASE